MSNLRKGLIISGGSHLVMIISLFQAMILSRALGPAGSGQLFLVHQFVIVMTNLSSLGLPMALMHGINKGRVDVRRGLHAVLLTTTVASTLSGLVALLVLMRWSGFFGGVGLPLAVGSCALIVTVSMRTVYAHANLALFRAKDVVLISSLPLAVLVFLYGALYFSTGITVEIVIFLEVAILGVGGWILASILTKRAVGDACVEHTADWNFLRDSFRFGVGLMFVDFMVSAKGYLTAAILKYFSDDLAAVGYFTRGLRLATLTVLSIQTLQRFMFARWAKLDGEELARSVEVVSQGAVLLVLVLGAVLMIGARPLTILMYGEQFLPAIPIMRISILGVSIYLIAQMLQSVFSSSGTSKYNLLIQAAGVLSTAALSLLLVPKHKEIGSAYASTIGYGIMGLISLYIAQAKFGVRLHVMLRPSPEIFLRMARRFS